MRKVIWIEMDFMYSYLNEKKNLIRLAAFIAQYI